MADTLITLTALYLIFQVGLGTWVRLMGTSFSKNDPLYIDRKTYLMLLIPFFGVLYAVFCVIKLALKKE